MTAADAAWSIKRLLMLSTPIERVARDVYCPDVTFRSPDDSCAGIAVEGDDLVLTPPRSDLRSHVITELTRAEFGVVHRAGVNAAGRIVDDRATTGAYRVAKDDADGAWRLSARTVRRDGSPHDVQLIPVDGVFRVGGPGVKIDFATGHAADLAEGSGELFSHQTLPLRLRVARFSPRLMKSTTAAQRAAIARRFARPSAIPAETLFPPSGPGAIGPHPTGDGTETRVDTESGDVEVIDLDWLWCEDVAALANLVSELVFHADAGLAMRWLSDHLTLNDREQRARHLRQAHAHALANAYVYPIDARPRVTLARAPWTFRATPFTPSVEFRDVRIVR